MNESFKPEAQSKVDDIFCKFFVNLKKRDTEKMKKFVTRYDKISNITKKKNMEITPTVLRLKLLHDFGISATDRKLVLTEVNFDKPEEVYKKANA